MRRGSVGGLVGMGLCLMFLPVLPRGAAAAEPRKPNILLILSDDLGAGSLSCLGGTVPTPHLDSLAKNGMTFTQAYAAPMCAPTRDELMTGLSRTRFKGRPGRETPFFSNHLQELGYANAIAGKWFVGCVFDPPLRGFDESLILVNGYRHWAPDFMVFDSKGLFRELNQPRPFNRLKDAGVALEGSNKATRMPERYADDVEVDFLCDFMERNRERPFFAYYCTKLAHVPMVPNPDSSPGEIAVAREAFQETDDTDLTGLSERITKLAGEKGVNLGHDYADGAVRYLDKVVGRLLIKLEELHLSRDTLVIFLSDNGNSARDHVKDGVQVIPGKKGDSLDGGTLIPLVFCWPGRIAAGSTCNDLVHVQDFGPTLMELAGGRMPEGLACDGRSFAPQLLGQKGHPREWFIGYGAHPSVYLERVKKEFGGTYENGKLAWIRGTRFKLYNDGRFYDLDNDRGEEHWIKVGTGTPEVEAIRRKLQGILDEYTQRPLVDGRM